MANIFYWSVLLETVMHYKLCTVKKKNIYIYIYSYMSKKHPLQQLYVIGIWREFPNNSLLLLLFLLCLGFLFLFCVENWYLKKKKRKAEKKRLLFTDWKITAFYTTEILS